jgi:hypothetical protein
MQLTPASIILLTVYIAIKFSRLYYHNMILTVILKKQIKEMWLEWLIAILSTIITAYFFFKTSLLFPLIIAGNVVATYYMNLNLPAREDETSDYLTRVTLRANSNVVEASQFECVVDMTLFFAFLMVTNYG